MPKLKEKMHGLPARRSVRGATLKSTAITRPHAKRFGAFVRQKRKRKVGVTLISVAERKRQNWNQCLDETFTDASTKQKLNGTVHDIHEYSEKHSSKENFSCDTYNNADYDASSVLRYRTNDSFDTCPENSPICFSPIIIDNSSDADCSSAADTTNVYCASAVGDGFDGENVDNIAQENDKITPGFG